MKSAKVILVSLVSILSLPGVSLAQQQSSPAGTVSYTTSQSIPSTCGSPAVAVEFTGWYFTDSQGQTHTFPGTSRICTPIKYASIFSGFTSVSTDGLYQITTSGRQGSVLNENTFDPLFKVTSILYSPPGNQSTQGYSSTTTSGTTTTVGSSFTYAQEITYSSGSKDLGISGSASWGITQGTSNSSAFTQSWADATTIASDANSNSALNPTASNAVNHNLDVFEIWLNPQVTALSQDATPVSYSVTALPTPGVSAPVVDVIGVPGIVMEPAPAGVTTLNPSGQAGVSTVPVSLLIPQAIANDQGTGNAYMPGLGAICRNNSLYLQQLANPNTLVCTQANQCGCTPSDFSAVLTTDALLNYNPSTLTASPFPGDESPLDADSIATASGVGSGPAVCGQNPVPAGSNCRFVIVPIASGSTTPDFQLLDGTAQSASYQQTDGTSSTFTTGSSIATNVGVSFTVGPMISNVKTADTWTWTDSEGVGNSSGQSNAMTVLFKSSTAGCNENVNIYEDTVFHTFVFQVPSGNYGCQ